MTTTIPVSAALLRQCLNAVLPHAGDDDTIPALVAVRVEARDGHLFLAATDRYTIGVARCKIRGGAVEPFGVQLDADAAAELALHLENAAGAADDVAAMVLDGDKLTVDYGPHEPRAWGVSTAEWPDWRSLLHAALTAERGAELDDEYGLDPAKLAKFNIAGEDEGWWVPESLRMSVRRSGSPIVVVSYGTWFVGAIMPTRLTVNAQLGDPPPLSPAAIWGEWTVLTAPAEEAESA